MNMKKIIISTSLASIILLAVSGCGADTEENVSTVSPDTTVAEVIVVETTTTTTTAPEIPVIEEVVQYYEEPVSYYEEPAPVYVAEVAPPASPVIPSGGIEDMICSAFGDQCSKALSVAWCESNYNPGVVGGAGERGLFQIHPVHIPNLGPYGGWDAMFDPSANIAYAYALYSGSGWGPWSCA
jgi:hypothetical protein